MPLVRANEVLRHWRHPGGQAHPQRRAADGGQRRQLLRL